MHYTSTRSRCSLSASQVIVKGIAEDGGLFVPDSFPRISEETFQVLEKASYLERAETVLSLFLNDFTPEEIRSCVRGAYTGKFENEEPAPLSEPVPGVNLLELWHGPTCAFKDMALQLLPRLLSISAAKAAPGRTMVILVATSGDTGKAALDGFADVKGTKIVVFYPAEGVSAMQKLQMQTQAGNNVAVCGIEGNFDDAQNGVKAIFADRAIKDILDRADMDLSSANSINFGRLVPQIVYYVSAFCDLRKTGRLRAGESFNIVVPTGNFGNILAAEYAKRMGVPVAKLICASNRNNVLTDFIETGVYDRNRPFHTTTSPSMDILISSNLERLLYHLSGNDPELVRGLMAQLKSEGKYTVPDALKKKIQEEFTAGWCSDEEASELIGDLFRKHKYLCDTHTAVALKVCRNYRETTGDKKPCVVASTASPYKFAPAVLKAVGGGEADGFEATERLQALTGAPVPGPIAGLRNKPVLHKDCIRKDEMEDFLLKFLGIR